MSEPDEDEAREAVRAIVTGGKTLAEWQTMAALREAVPAADVTRTDFHAVYRVEAQGDLDDLCRAIVRQCGDRVGHVTALLRRVDTGHDAIRDAVAEVALEHVGPEQTFAFLHPQARRAPARPGHARARGGDRRRGLGGARGA